ncbi:MAG: Acg family FMN-binding oxidoreductase [Bosea sp. (in: a-proteobacteria)]
MQRRDFLRLVGGGTILAAISAGLVEAQVIDPTAAWSMAAVQDGDIRHRALAYAILSPNPHNRQPWLVDLRSPEQVQVFCDPERLLTQTDPFSRQIIIGLGAFIETFVIAASHMGRAVDVRLFPQGFPTDRIDQRPVASLVMGGPASPDPLFAHILTRRSVKAPYDMTRTIPAEAINSLTTSPRKALHAIKVETDPEAVANMRGFMTRGGGIEVMTPRTWLESVELMRIGSAEIAANPDGISMGGPMIETLLANGRISRAVMADTSSPVFRAGTERYTASTAATPAAIWYATPGNSREDQIEAGRAWMRIALTATSLGLSLHPMSQVLQEFAEMAAELAAFHDHVGVKAPARVQMLSRIGYGPTVGASPRWPLQTRIRTA